MQLILSRLMVIFTGLQYAVQTFMTRYGFINPIFSTKERERLEIIKRFDISGRSCIVGYDVVVINAANTLLPLLA